MERVPVTLMLGVMEGVPDLLPLQRDLAAGTYTVTATDGSGCTDTETVYDHRAYGMSMLQADISNQRKL